MAGFAERRSWRRYGSASRAVRRSDGDGSFRARPPVRSAFAALAAAAADRARRQARARLSQLDAQPAQISSPGCAGGAGLGPAAVGLVGRGDVSAASGAPPAAVGLADQAADRFGGADGLSQTPRR